MEHQLPFRSFYHRTSKNIEKDKQEVRVFCVIRVICSLFSGEQVVSSEGDTARKLMYMELWRPASFYLIKAPVQNRSCSVRQEGTSCECSAQYSVGYLLSRGSVYSFEARGDCMWYIWK